MLADGSDIETLDRMSKEISQMDAAGMGTGSGRAVLGDIDKIKKVAALLEAVGEAVIPVIIETTVNSDKPAPLSGEPSTASKVIPRGLHLLHSAITQQSNTANDVEPNMLKEAAEEDVKDESKEDAKEETTQHT